MTPWRGDLITEARQQLWREGRALEYLLDDGQREWTTALQERGGSWVWNIGRQRGKTYAALSLACDFCLKRKSAIVRYCAKTKDSALGITEPNMKAILEDCPDELRPIKRGEYVWWFPSTDATLVIFGTDAQSFAKGRGPKTDFQLFDEFGFYQDPVGVEQALMPALQTTNGPVLYLSTPAESTAHAYTARIRSHQASGKYRHDTWWSNTRVNHEAIIEQECERLGMSRAEFLASTYYRREYLAEVVTESSLAAMPWWINNYEAATKLVRVRERPKYFDAYAWYDWAGARDPHAALFAWYSPTDGLHIEAELERPLGTTLEAFCREAKELERTRWGVNGWEGKLLGAPEWLKALETVPEYLKGSIVDGAPRQPYLRVGDDNPAVLAEMQLTHKYTVLPTRKDDKHVAVDRANAMWASGRVTIDPSVVRFLEQLGASTWTKTRTEWERTEKDHADLIDCFVYGIRNMRWNREVRPASVVAVESQNTPPWQRSNTPDKALKQWESMLRAKRH